MNMYVSKRMHNTHIRMQIHVKNFLFLLVLDRFRLKKYGFDIKLPFRALVSNFVVGFSPFHLYARNASRVSTHMMARGEIKKKVTFLLAASPIILLSPSQEARGVEN